MTNHLSPRQIRRQILRLRELLYGTLLLGTVMLFCVALSRRTPLKLDVIRDRGAMGRIVANGSIENVYRLEIMNTAKTAHRYRITVAELPSIRRINAADVQLDGPGSRGIPVRVLVDRGTGKPGSNPIRFVLQAIEDPHLAVVERAFFLCRNNF